MVLFIFIIMMLNLGTRAIAQESQWLSPRMWVGPAILCVILFAELVFVLVRGGARSANLVFTDPKQVSLTLFGPYVLGVELASMLLLAGLVGAFHLGKRLEPGRVAEQPLPSSNELMSN